jgi:hypothetical protein
MAEMKLSVRVHVRKPAGLTVLDDVGLLGTVRAVGRHSGQAPRQKMLRNDVAQSGELRVE